MTTSESALTLKARTFAREYLKLFPKHFYFHDLEHTEDVAQAAETIGKECSLSDDDLELVVLSAWFHDLGYIDSIDHHEEASCKIAVGMLNLWRVDPVRIEIVQKTIMATKIPQRPSNLLEMILCDADLSYLASDHFLNRSCKLREEFDKLRAKHFLKDADWWQYNLEFMRDHQYFTEYSEKILTPRKIANVEIVFRLAQRFNN